MLDGAWALCSAAVLQSRWSLVRRVRHAQTLAMPLGLLAMAQHWLVLQQE